MLGRKQNKVYSSSEDNSSSNDSSSDSDSSEKDQKPLTNKEDLQSAIDQLSEIEKSFGEVDQDQKEVKSWMFLKDIDFIMALDAIVYQAKINNNLCDVKKIISSVEYGFNQLKCTQSYCSEKGIMCHKRNNDISAEIYCEEHSNLVDQLSEGIYYFDAELKKDKSILKSLERLLVVVQEQMEYLVSENSNKDMTAYSSIKAKLDEEYGNLKNTLRDMTLKAKKITMKEKETVKKPQYEHISFVKPDSQKCMQSISGILRLMFEANMKSEIEAKLKTILNWSAGIEQYKKESKSYSVYSVPNKIYGKEFMLCKIPTQTLKKLKELEARVQTLAKAAIAYQKNVYQHKATINQVKKMLIKINKKNIDDQLPEDNKIFIKSKSKAKFSMQRKSNDSINDINIKHKERSDEMKYINKRTKEIADILSKSNHYNQYKNFNYE